MTVVRSEHGCEIEVGDDQVIIAGLGGEPNLPPPAGMFGLRIYKVKMFWFDGRTDTPTTEWVLSIQHPITGVGRVRRTWPA